MQSLRIFISSPGDVSEERQITGKVIERLQGKYWSFVRLDDVFWERRAIRATAHYQDELIQPGNCGLVVGLLWSRLGSPLPKKFARFADSAAPTGTEWELEEAFDAYEANRAKLEKAGRDPQQAAREAKPDILIYRRKPAPDRATLDAARLNQLDQLEAYLLENYFNDDGTIKRPILGYKDLGDFEKKLTTHLEELILRQIPEVSPGFEPPPISGSPFKGLQAFDFKDSDRYFGRNREIRELQHQLVASAGRGLPFMLIYGGSGFGKSSIMRAGLAPVLTRPGGSLDTISGWRRVPFQPAVGKGPLIERFVRALLQPPTPEEAEHSRLNDHWPLTGLAEFGGREIEGTTWDTAALVRHLCDDDQRVFAISAIVETLESLDRHLLLEIDQLEELFTTPTFDVGQRSTFLNTVGDLCLTGSVWTVATMRSEFFPRVAEQPELFHLVGKDRGYILPPPDRQSLREIIRYPALAARIDFEQRIKDYQIAGETAKHDHLHDQILADAESSPDALPLLEFTLQKLYDERRGDFLTWDSYADAGGLKGAIAKRATEIYDSLPAHAREASHRVFAALVHIDPSKGTITRQRAPLKPLKSHPGTEAFFQSFLDAHLLVTDEDGNTNEPVITLAHEALISHWDELSTWINDHRGDLLARQRLAEQVGLWVANGRKKSYFLSEARLAEAERVAESHIFTLNYGETSFLLLSKQQARRKLILLKSVVAVFAILALVAAAAGYIAQEKTKEALAAISKNEANLAAASNADLAAALEALDADLVALRAGERSDGFAGKSKWHEAVALLNRSLERNPKNQLALNLLHDSINLHGRMRWDIPFVEIPHELFTIEAEFNHNGSKLITAIDENTLQIWNSTTGHTVGVQLIHEKSVSHAHFSPDGAQVLTASGNKVSVWDADSGDLLGDPILQREMVVGARYSPDGSHFITLCADSTVQIWNASERIPVTDPIAHDQSLASVVFSSEETVVSIFFDSDAKDSAGVKIWDWTTGGLVGELHLNGNFFLAPVASPDNLSILTVDNENTAEIWDLVTGEARGEPMRHQESIISAEFSPDGTLVVTASADRTAQLWDSASGRALGKKMQHGELVHSARFSPDGTRMVTASWDRSIRVWNAATGDPMGGPIHHPNWVFSAQFDASGTHILTISGDMIARVWSASTGQATHKRLQSHYQVNSAQLSPDGNLVVTAAWDKTAQVWNASSGKAVGKPMPHRHWLISAGFVSGGKEVMTTDCEGNASTWDFLSGNFVGNGIVNADAGMMYATGQDSINLVAVHISSVRIRPASLFRIDKGSAEEFKFFLRWLAALSGIQHTKYGDRELIASEERLRVLMQNELLPPNWREISRWLQDRTPGAKVLSSGTRSFRQIAESERDATETGTVARLTLAMEIDYTLPLARILLAGALEQDSRKEDLGMLARIAFLRRYDLDLLAAQHGEIHSEELAVLYARAAESLNNARPGAKVGIGPRATDIREEALAAAEHALALNPNLQEAVQQRSAALESLNR